jgi:hypothetical protein
MSSLTVNTATEDFRDCDQCISEDRPTIGYARWFFVTVAKVHYLCVEHSLDFGKRYPNLSQRALPI